MGGNKEERPFSAVGKVNSCFRTGLLHPSLPVTHLQHLQEFLSGIQEVAALAKGQTEILVEQSNLFDINSC